MIPSTSWVGSLYWFMNGRKQQVSVREDLYQNGLMSWVEFHKDQSWVPSSLSCVWITYLKLSDRKPRCLLMTEVYNRVQRNSIRGSDIIQDDLHHLNNWLNKRLLRFNALKCKCMHVGSNNPEITYTFRGGGKRCIYLFTWHMTANHHSTVPKLL